MPATTTRSRTTANKQHRGRPCLEAAACDLDQQEPWTSATSPLSIIIIIVHPSDHLTILPPSPTLTLRNVSVSERRTRHANYIKLLTVHCLLLAITKDKKRKTRLFSSLRHRAKTYLGHGNNKGHSTQSQIKPGD